MIGIDQHPSAEPLVVDLVEGVPGTEALEGDAPGAHRQPSRHGQAGEDLGEIGAVADALLRDAGVRLVQPGLDGAVEPLRRPHQVPRDGECEVEPLPRCPTLADPQPIGGLLELLARRSVVQQEARRRLLRRPVEVSRLPELGDQRVADLDCLFARGRQAQQPQARNRDPEQGGNGVEPAPCHAPTSTLRDRSLALTSARGRPTRSTTT